MPEIDYFHAFKSSIVRIYHANGMVVGAGFLVFDRLILTCAHVVTAALGIPTTTQEKPEASVFLDFPLLESEKLTAKVVFWQPVNPPQSQEDIAGLQIESQLPAAARPVRFVSASDVWGHSFRLFGFPAERDVGVWASGVLRDRLANEWMQLESVTVPGYAVQPGFSGAPVWDEALSGVVGMAVAAEKKRQEVKAAFMIPTSVLSTAWEDLNSLIVSPSDSAIQSTVPDFREVRRKAFQKNLALLYTRWEAAYNQRSATLNQSEIPQLDQQLKGIEQQIDQTQREIQNLGL